MNEPQVAGYPLSPLQARVWALGGAEGPCQVQAAIPLAPGSTPDGVQARVAEIVRRHEILRTAFAIVPHLTTPLQVVAEAAALTLEPRQLDGDAALDRLLADERRRRQAGGQPVRWCLAAGAVGLILVVTASALCADPATLRLLARELREGAGPEPLQYADYASWQQDVVAGERGRQAARHRPGSGAPAPDAPFRPEVVIHDIDDGCWHAVRSAAAELGVSPRALLLAAWQALTWHLAAGDELVVALVADGRDDAGLATAAGLYERRLPVPAIIGAALSFAALAAAAEAGVAAALEWGDVPSLEAWQPLGFAFEDEAPGDVSRLWSCTDRFELELRVRRLPAGWTAELAYDAHRLAAADARRLAGRYVRLLAQVAARPRAAVADLELCEPDELRLAVQDGPHRPVAGCLHELVEAQAARTPDACAVIADGERLDYAELDRRAGAVARLLRQRGAGRGTRVGLHLGRSPEAIIAALAVWKTGAATVPVDAAASPAYALALLERAGAAILVTAGAGVPGFTGPVLRLDGALESPPAPETGSPAGPDDVAYVVHTSGSTGRPHGVVVPHRPAVSYLSALATAHGLDGSDVVLQLAPPTFDAWLRDAIGPLMAGATVAVAPAGESGAALLERMERHRVTRLLSIVPSVLRDLVAQARSGGPAPAALRTVLVSGEVLHLADCEAVWEAFGAGVAIHNQYGPTECTMTTTSGPVTPEQRNRASALLGRPIANARTSVLSDGLRPLPPGMRGEICIGGIGPAHGYLDQPGLTAARFLPDPFGGPGARLYRTGDVGRVGPDGALEFLGRRDGQVKVEGVRVEPAEIEAALASHPDVREAAVVPAASEAGGLRLVAFVVAAGQAPTPAALRAHLSARLTDALVPASFAVLESLPRTAHGKVDRRRLRDEADRAPRQAAFVAPASDRERLIAAVFTETLGVERVGARDSFFDLGGHSLLAARATYQLSERLGVELSLRTIFEHPTPAELAAAIEAAAPAAGAGDRITRVEREPAGGWPLTVTQRRIWLLDELDPGNPSYNVRLAIRFSGELRPELLRRGLDAIVERQEALRTTIVRAGEDAAQVVREPAPVPMPVVDLAGEAEIGRLIREQAARPFDLARGPLLRASLLRLAETEHVLVLTMHHSVIDEWSTGILLRELIDVYEALRSGRPARLPELEVRTVDFAVWQRRWLAGPRLERLLAHWTGQLREAPFEVRLPVDRPRPAVPSTGGGRLTTMLPRPLTEALAELARREEATAFMVLLSAFLLLLQKVSGQDDLVVGSPIANRTRPEVEPLIGFFANILLLRVELAGDPTFRELLARVRSVAVDAYAHQEVPFERLVEALRPARLRHRTPLVQVWFVLHNAPMPDLELRGLRLALLPTESDTAKFDLNFALTDVGGDLLLAVEYSTDLFEEATARWLLEGYQALLAHVARHPEERASEIHAVVPLRPKGDRQMTLEEQGRESRRGSRMAGLRTARPAAVRVSQESLVRSGPLHDGQPLPLLVEPAGGQLDLAGWIAAERDWASARLLEHGGILFRGFDVDSVETFERVIQAHSQDLLDYYERSTPRKQVGGKVYTSTEYPPERHIPLHCESAYSYYWPLKIWFHCVVPASEGGATPICDSRRVLELIDPAVRRRFEEARVMYVRNYHEGFDIPWQVAFQTDDPQVVAEYCRRVGMEFEWRENGVLRTRQVLDAVVGHPVTGQALWFNQAHAFHISTLDQDVQRGMRELFSEDDLPRDVRYGDGSPIGAAELDAVRAAIAAATIAFPWQRGDVLMLDNMLVAHGREPYRGERRVVVGMSEPWDRRKLADRLSA